MASQTAIAPKAAPNLSSSVLRVLALPWLDRTIAAIACVPLAYGVYYRYTHFHHGLPLIASVLNTSITILTMVVRRPPKRVTPNPWYWLLAFVATYWLVFIISFLQKRTPFGCQLDHRSISHPGPAGGNLGPIEPGTKHRLRAGPTRTREHRCIRLHAPSGVHGDAFNLHRFRAAGVQPDERAVNGTWRLLVHSDQERGRGRLSAPRSAICGLHAEGSGTMDSVRDLTSINVGADYAKFVPAHSSTA